MPICNVKLTRKDIVANPTMAFHLEKPDGFEFRAGQFGDITLLNPGETDEEGNIRGFSLAHAPYEGDLMMATCLRDTAFKRVLKELPIGSKRQSAFRSWRSVASAILLRRRFCRRWI